MEWRAIDLKIIIWVLMIGLQQVGSSYLIKSAQLASDMIRIHYYDQLVFEFNVVYALILLLNIIIRHYISISDTTYFDILRLHLTIRQQYVTDYFCIVICLIYIARVLFLIF